MHKISLNLITAIAFLAGSVACAGPGIRPAMATSGAAQEVTQMTGCSLVGSSNWQAWINRMPGVDMEPRLHVSGQVTSRSGGYTFTWKEGPLDRSSRPLLRLELIATPPDGLATQAITTQEVAYSKPVGGLSYRGVLISCAEEILSEISPIEDVY